jgi:hypothetical protein
MEIKNAWRWMALVSEAERVCCGMKFIAALLGGGAYAELNYSLVN